LIDKLELLLALAKEPHFGRAAEARGVTQPTTSTSLGSLRKSLASCWCNAARVFKAPEGERTLVFGRIRVGAHLYAPIILPPASWSRQPTSL